MITMKDMIDKCRNSKCRYRFYSAWDTEIRFDGDKTRLYTEVSINPPVNSMPHLPANEKRIGLDKSVWIKFLNSHYPRKMELNFVETVNTLNPFSIRLDKYNNVNSGGFTWIFRNEMLVLRFQKVIYRWKACTKMITDV